MKCLQLFQELLLCTANPQSCGYNHSIEYEIVVLLVMTEKNGKSVNYYFHIELKCCHGKLCIHQHRLH